MGGVVDTIAVILFIIVLFIVIAGFNRQMVEKNKERRDMQLKREAERLEKEANNTNNNTEEK
ncbi:MAG: hypothetical protein PHF17_10035 [Arcobacteraceae bacterium]|jgi:uncharacterized membrane protein|nr:hypothetical protein [Arcobacteraceae bacterium]